MSLSVVKIDPQAFKQVLSNLLSNALKFTLRDGARVDDIHVSTAVKVRLRVVAHSMLMASPPTVKAKVAWAVSIA